LKSIVDQFFAHLRNIVQGDVRTDAYSRIFYSTDASIYQVMPLGVLIPRTIEDVQQAVLLAREYPVPILARTSGSSLAGQAINQALIIDFTRHLDRILEVNPEERWVRVQPGVVLDALNAHLKPYGLQYGPDPASSNRAAMGGIVSNNSTGAHSILYGMTVEHVLEMDVILADGSQVHFQPVEADQLPRYEKRPGLEGKIYREIHQLIREHQEVIRRGTPRHWRRCGGYNLDRFIEGVSHRYSNDTRFNLSKLICGAEGTLGVITEVKLNLVPRPKKTALALVQFPGLYQALSAVPTILETHPSAVELLDHMALTLCKGVPQYARLLQTFIQGEPNCVLITEFYGDSEPELRRRVQHLKDHLQRKRIRCTVVPAIDPRLQDNVWTVRKVGLGLLMSIKGDYKPIPFIEDAAVPVEHLADYVDQVERFCNELGTRVAYYAHASAGCLHIRPLMNTKLASEVEKLPLIASFAAELVSSYGGVFSSEHGDGRVRSWINERFYGPELYRLFKQVKNIFDPRGIFNPGIIVDGPPMTENLRYGSGYRTVPVKTILDFSDDGGFDRAIEMCNGAGVCRKRTTGTMCPSFMATREEEHSTRGRANALRAALSGKLPFRELTGERMFQVLDLCVECKACKAECPSSVDMAKIKTEFLAQYYRVHRMPLRNRLFARAHQVARWSAGPQAMLVNAILRQPITRWILEKTLGISRHRTLPPYARQPFFRGYRQSDLSKGELSSRDQNAPTVVLMVDTFSQYHEPWIPRAAVQLLQKMGFRVIVPRLGCCGRPMISKGMIEPARQAARTLVQQLQPYVQQNCPIVGLEPGCILALRDDYHYLLPENERVKQASQLIFTFEEFVSNHLESLTRLMQSRKEQHLLVHGHCHQKSLVGMEPTRRVLEAIPGSRVTIIDSSCCGMAGSFGYEAEHYAISLQMGEHRLFPAVRSAPPDAVIVASGFSCRQQIRHATGKSAHHPAEVLVGVVDGSVQ